MTHKNSKTVLIAVFLIAIWNGSAWLITKSNYTSNIQELVERETKLSKVQAADLADSITRNLNYIHGISDLLSQVTHVKEAVSRFGATVARSPLSFAKKQKLWTADIKLKEVNRYLYYAHLALQADLIYVANAAGDIIAASNYEDQGSAVGANIAAREYFAANKNRQRGMQFAVGMTTNIPGIYFSTPIFIDRKFMGAVVVKVNVPDLTFLVSQVNSFVTDVNGVIILSRDQDLAMHAFPGAPISRISVNDRLYRYKRSDFPVAEIEPWSADGHYSLVRIQNKKTPRVLISKDIPEYALKVYVDNPVTEFDSLAQYRLWFTVMLGLSGSALILIASGTVAYLGSIKRSRALLSEQKDQIETFLQASNDGIHLLDSPGYLVMANDRFCRMLGYTHEELMSINVSQWENTILGDDVQERISGLLQTKRGTVYEARYKRKDGREFDVEISAVPVKVGGRELLYNSARDISLRKRLQEELSLATLIVNNSSEGMMVSDSDARIIAVNPAFTKITGYSFDEVKGKTPALFDSGRHDAAFYQAMRDKLITTGQWQGEIWDRDKNRDLQAKWLTTNVIRSADGSVHRYVTLFSDITEMKRTDELVWRQANFDALTELPNRLMFRTRLEEEVAKSDRSKLSLALLLIDLDQFKEVNDTLGHDIGDLLLKEAAQRISICVRDTDTVARLGGDEFTVILSNLSDHNHVEDCAQRIIRELVKPFHLGNEVIYVTASIGITTYPNDAADIDALIKNADQAMYVAKSKGRNRFSYFTQALQQVAQKRMRLIYDLRNALANDQFRVYFQPIVEVASGRIHKAEALLRWQHPERGMVGPLEFIPLAEEIGLINEIGDWIFKESARWAKRWSDVSMEGFQISVNISPIQFMSANNICSAWSAHMRELGLPGKNIVMEITEGFLLNADANVIDKLLKFRDAGIQLAIDDFGTGYSSLAYLKKFHIDYLKIDKSFVDNLVTDENDMALSEAIIVLAHKLGLKVVAEGVESERQRSMLAAVGCDYVQGYLFSQPIPPGEFEILLKNDWNRRLGNVASA